MFVLFIMHSVLFVFRQTLSVNNVSIHSVYLSLMTQLKPVSFCML